MYIKEELNNKKGVGIGVGVALVIVALTVLAFETGLVASGGQGKMYVSGDDGATFETGSIKEFPPYMSGGKEYVRAVVFDNGSKRFVGYLTKFGDSVRTRLLEAQEKLGSSTVNCYSTGQIDTSNVFVKKPGDHDWVSLNDRRASNIQTVKDAQGKLLQPVQP
jgi:hypothetical protein